MRRVICLLTAAAMALQATGAAAIPLPILGGVRGGLEGSAGILPASGYDDAGRTETIDKFGETTTFEYDEASRPEKMTYDTGAYALYTYDGRSRIKAVEHKNSSNTLLRKETNVYDPASRITSRYEGPASGGVTTTFGYDDAGQLTSESSSGYSASYSYDANGNRTNRTVNGVSETYTVDDSDKLTSVTWSNGLVNYSKEYAYHYSGRPTSITYKTNGVTQATETMTWDKESRMLTNSLANASYVYNGFDARVSKTVSSTTTTFKRAGAEPVSPVLADTVGGTTTNHLPGISSRTGGTSTFSHSGIKNGLLQTNSSQTNTATKRYDAFGNELSSSGTWQTRFDYGGAFGYQRDDESNYKLLGHRYYDPEIGRFLTRDPIKDGRNWYAYCENDPVRKADPSGLTEVILYWYPVIGGGYHAGIEVKDNLTPGKPTKMLFAGGPSIPGNLPRGHLVPWGGPPVRGVPEHEERSRKKLYGVKLVDDDSRWTAWAKKLTLVENEMLAEVPFVSYSPLPKLNRLLNFTVLPTNLINNGPFANSNSWARELLDRTGLTPTYESAVEKRGGSPWTPGWSNDPWSKR